MVVHKVSEVFHHRHRKGSRPYLKPKWVNIARERQGIVKDEVQEDGRVRRWVYIEKEGKYLRVVFLPDGNTVHNAFFDRNFKEEAK